MKKNLVIAFMLSGFLLSSCFVHTVTVGSGGSGAAEKHKNHYLIGGLVPAGVKDTKEYVGDSKNYTIVFKQTFVDGLLACITAGIYTPTTVIITK